MQPATPPTSAILFALGLTFAGCSNLDTITNTRESGPEDQAYARPLSGAAPSYASAEDLRTNIARLEQSRGTGGGYLETLVQHEDPSVRLKATMALGRMPLDRYGRNVTNALELALRDEDSSVRRAAAFALGVRGDVSCADLLIGALDEEDPDVRAQIWLAMGRLDREDLRIAGLRGLQDPAPAAQRAACQAIFYWPADSEQWPVAAAGLKAVAADGSREARWMALFTLARREELRGEWSPFLHALASADSSAQEKLFATLGLARAAQDAMKADSFPSDGLSTLSKALETCARNPDPQVATEALRGLRTLGKGISAPVREHVLNHASKNVRAAGLAALAKEARSMEYASALSQDPSPMVRRAAFAVIVELNPVAGIPLVREWARSADYRHRRAAATAAGFLETNEAQGILLALLSDKHPQVVETAIETLASSQNRAIRFRIRELCSDKDNGIALAAVGAIAEGEVTAQDLPFLVEAYDKANGDVGPEVRFNSLLAAAKIEGTEPNDFLRVAASDRDGYVAQVAREQLTKRGIALPTDLDPPQASLVAPETAAEFNLALGNPKVAIETNRGTLVLELYPSVAPTHVHNLLSLAARGHYDGLTWHRVVSDFVVQGGCYRGDGNGSGTWRGSDDALGQEFNPLHYSAGALGMPRNQNPDSGGSQIFITHRATPHLDGRYTLFGQLESGWKTLEELEEGDLILSVRRLH